MPEVIATIDQLQTYLSGVSARADHHAQGVSEVVLAIAGAVVLFKDPGTDLQILVREGNTGNVLWLHIGGERYAISYNHRDQAVEVRERTTRGDALASFDNHSTAGDVTRFFAGLGEHADAAT